MESNGDAITPLHLETEGSSEAGVIANQQRPQGEEPFDSSRYWQDPERKRCWIILTAALLSIYLFAITILILTEFKLTNFPEIVRVLVVLGGFVLSTLPIFYWWKESSDFERWIARESLKGLGDIEKEFERQRFKTNSEFARAFWTALIVIFSAFLITIK